MELKIKLKTNVQSDKGSHKKGEVVSLDSKDATSLIARNLATEVKEPKKATTEPVEDEQVKEEPKAEEKKAEAKQPAKSPVKKATAPKKVAPKKTAAKKAPEKKA